MNFHPNTQSKNFISMGYFCPKYMRFELKNTEELSFLTLSSDAKFEKTLILRFQKWHEELSELSLEYPKSLEIVHWWALFVQSIYCFSYKIPEELCVMTLKGIAKFKQKLTCGLKNDIRNLINFHASSRKSECLHFDWIFFVQSIQIFR